MERIAKEKVIIYTPNGFLPQKEYDLNIFQLHKSGWSVDELKKLGYRVKGINGLKFLRKRKAPLEFRYKKLKVFNVILSDLTQKITYYSPDITLQLLAIKNMSR